MFRVSGTLDGKTVRKNFKSRAEAVAYRRDLEIEFLNGESGGQTVWTTLTHDQNRDAIAAVNMLKRGGSSKSIIRRHYLDLKSVEEAARFWRIVPEGMALPETMEKKDGRYVVEPVRMVGG